MTFKVELRKTCKICSKPITTKRFRTYCSKSCRTKNFTNKYNDYRTAWTRAKRDCEASIPSDYKVQCLVCKKYYIQVCTHVFEVHHMTAKEYKKEYGLDVKAGRVPKWYKQVKGDIALENKTFLNLKVGKKFWFKKGSKTAGRYERSPETMERLSILGSRTIRSNSKFHS